MCWHCRAMYRAVRYHQISDILSEGNRTKQDVNYSELGWHVGMIRQLLPFRTRNLKQWHMIAHKIEEMLNVTNLTIFREVYSLKFRIIHCLWVIQNISVRAKYSKHLVSEFHLRTYVSCNGTGSFMIFWCRTRGRSSTYGHCNIDNYLKLKNEKDKMVDCVLD